MMESRISGNLRVKSGTQPVAFADSDDGSIIERCQHLYTRADFRNGWPANEKGMKRCFTQHGYRQISFKTFPLTTERITTDSDVHHSQQGLAFQSIVRLFGQQNQAGTGSPDGETLLNQGFQRPIQAIINHHLVDSGAVTTGYYYTI